MDGKGVSSVNPEGRDVVIKRLSEIVSMCESMDDLDDSRELVTDNAAMGLAKLQDMNSSLSSQLRNAEEAMRSAEVRVWVCACSWLRSHVALILV